MTRKFHVGFALAVSVALLPFALVRQGIVSNEAVAGNGAMSYFTLKPGASKTFMNGTESRICHDDGPPVDVIIGNGTETTRMLGGSMCVFSIGRNITLKNETSSPIRLHSKTVQKTGH